METCTGRQSHISNKNTYIHPERYKLQIAASPHYAAQQEAITIKKEDFILPQSSNNILVETAGGLMSPLANNFLISSNMNEKEEIWSNGIIMF